jgi:hypothetical protein
MGLTIDPNTISDERREEISSIIPKMFSFYLKGNYRKFLIVKQLILYN